MRRLRYFHLLLWLALVLFSHSALAQDGSFVRDGVQLYYRATGSGAPMVVLSGGPGFEVDYMVPVADFLPASNQRIFYEQRGTGRSRVTMTAENLTLEHVVADLEALRIHLKQERLFLVGHSWGGMLAMAYAAAHPSRVDRMILIGPGGPTLEFTEWFNDNIQARLRAEDVAAVQYWAEAARRGVDADKVALETVRAITPGYFFDRAKGLAFASQFRDGSLKIAVNQFLFADMGRNYDSRPGLARLDRPVLIVQGHQDPIGDRTAEDIHAAIKSSVVKYIKQCGHFPWLEQPEQFRRILTEFFEQ
jgi:proline iminopeptidase